MTCKPLRYRDKITNTTCLTSADCEYYSISNCFTIFILINTKSSVFPDTKEFSNEIAKVFSNTIIYESTEFWDGQYDKLCDLYEAGDAEALRGFVHIISTITDLDHRYGKEP